MNIEKVEVSTGFKYNSSEENDVICIEFNGVIEKRFSRLDESIKLKTEISGEISNRPNDENHFMASLEDNTSNFIGYVSLSKIFENEVEYGVSIYIKPNDIMLHMLINNPDKRFALKLSAKNKFSEATAFSIPRDTGKLLEFELEGEIIIPIYSASFEYVAH